MRTSAATSGQLLAWRAVDGQAEEIAWLAEVSIPVAVSDKVDESQAIEEENCEKDDDEGTLVCGRATRSILLCFYGGVEVLELAWVHDVGRRRVVLAYVSIA